MKYLWALLLLPLLAACGGTAYLKPYPDLDTSPDWVQDLVAQIETEKVSNPPSSLWRYDYHGNVVYFRPQQCCDIPSVLYDQAGNVICNPDGGIAGGNDARCPDFFEERTGEILIWRDSREY